jgi:hypothetical protein
MDYSEDPYSDIDAVIVSWVNKVGSSLFEEWAGEPSRFFHMPGLPPFECFQVSIAPPNNGAVEVVARAIDTNDDTEGDLERRWSGQIHELDAMIADAVTAIEGWKSRQIRPGVSEALRFGLDGTALGPGKYH